MILMIQLNYGWISQKIASKEEVKTVLNKFKSAGIPIGRWYIEDTRSP